jgi:hypothetical protein
VAFMDDIAKHARLGVVSRKKLIEEKFNADQLAYRVYDGSLIPVQRGIYRFRGVPQTWDMDALAAQMYVGEGSAVSHNSAAYLHGLEGFAQPKMIELLVPSGVEKLPSGVVLHRTFESFQTTERRGITTTSLARTVLDLADYLSMDETERVLNAAWRMNKRRMIPWLQQEIAKLKRKDWSGLDRVSQLVRRMGDRGLDSELELEVLKEIQRAGLPEPTKGLVILDDDDRYVIRGDLGWKEWKTVLHCDSVAWHGTEEAMLRDAAQRSELSVLKWKQITVMKRTLKDRAWLGQLDRALRPR